MFKIIAIVLAGFLFTVIFFGGRIGLEGMWQLICAVLGFLLLIVVAILATIREALRDTEDILLALAGKDRWMYSREIIIAVANIRHARAYTAGRERRPLAELGWHRYHMSVARTLVTLHHMEEEGLVESMRKIQEGPDVSERFRGKMRTAWSLTPKGRYRKEKGTSAKSAREPSKGLVPEHT